MLGTACTKTALKCVFVCRLLYDGDDRTGLMDRRRRQLWVIRDVCKQWHCSSVYASVCPFVQCTVWALGASFEATSSSPLFASRCSLWDRAVLISGFRLRIKYSSKILPALMEKELYCYTAMQRWIRAEVESVSCQIACWLCVCFTSTVHSDSHALLF